MRSPRPVSLRASLPLLPVAAVFAIGAVAARVVAGRAPLALARDFAQPLVVVTAWGHYGGVCFAVLATTLGLAALALGAALRATSAGTSPPPAAVAVAVAAALAAAFAWPFVFSSDVYAYAAYGSLTARGIDPYVPVPSDVHGAFVEAARWQWQGAFPPCVYGPAFVAFARAVVAAADGANVNAALLGLRLTACAAFLGCIFALASCLREMPERRRSCALIAFGLNPVALWSVAEGHNDALVLLVALTGFTLARRGAVYGAFLLGCSPLVKATGALFALGLALDTFLFAPRAGRRMIVALALGFAMAATLAIPPVLPALHAIGSRGRYLPSGSMQDVFGLAPVLTAALAAAAYGGVRLWGRERDGYAWLGIAAWLALPNPYPWYALWLLPAVVASGGGTAAAALYGVTISSVLRYLPDATGTLATPELRLAALLTASPLLLTLAVFARPLPFRKTSQT